MPAQQPRTSKHVLCLTDDGIPSNPQGFSWVAVKRGNAEYWLPVSPEYSGKPDLPPDWGKSSSWKNNELRVHIPTPLSPSERGFLVRIKLSPTHSIDDLHVFYADEERWLRVKRPKLAFDAGAEYAIAESEGDIASDKVSGRFAHLIASHVGARYTVFWRCVNTRRGCSVHLAELRLRFSTDKRMELYHGSVSNDPRDSVSYHTTKPGHYFRALLWLPSEDIEERTDHPRWQISFAPVEVKGLVFQSREPSHLQHGITIEPVVGRSLEQVARVYWELQRRGGSWDTKHGALMLTSADPAEERALQSEAYRIEGHSPLALKPGEKPEDWRVELYGMPFRLCLKDKTGHLVGVPAKAGSVSYAMDAVFSLSVQGVHLRVQVTDFRQARWSTTESLRVKGKLRDFFIASDAGLAFATHLNGASVEIEEDWVADVGRTLSVTVKEGAEDSMDLQPSRSMDAVQVTLRPFGIVRSTAELRPRSGGEILATYKEGPDVAATWSFATDEGNVMLTLPPQAVGEEMLKGPAAPPTTALTAGRSEFFQSRLSPNAWVKLDVTDVDSARAEPPWDIHALLGRRLGATGARLLSANWEMFYGVTASYDADHPEAPHLRLQEWGAQVGRIPLAPPGRDEVTDRRKDWFEKATDWSALMETRTAEYPVARADELRRPAPLQSGAGLSGILRSARVTAHPLDAGLSWSGQRADRETGAPLRGGPDYGLESRNIHDAIIGRRAAGPDWKAGDVPAHSISVDNLRWGPLGATGQQRVAFDKGRSWYISQTTQGRLDKLTIVRIGRIAGLWNKARHVIVYERRTHPSTQFATGHGGRAALRKVREFVEVTEIERRYPESSLPGEAFSAGPLCAAVFATARIDVDGSLGQDINDGWICPLRTSSGSTGVAHLHLARGEQKRGGTIAHQVEDCGSLFFYTSTNPKEGADPDAWAPVLGLDITPELASPPPTVFSLAPSLALSLDKLPAPSAAGLYQSSTTIRVRAPAEAANVTHGRSEKAIEARIHSVTISRGTWKPDPKLYEDMHAAAEAREYLLVLSNLELEKAEALWKVIEPKLEKAFAKLEKAGKLPESAARLVSTTAQIARNELEERLKELERLVGVLEQAADTAKHAIMAEIASEKALIEQELTARQQAMLRVATNAKEALAAASQYHLTLLSAQLDDTSLSEEVRLAALTITAELERFETAVRDTPMVELLLHIRGLLDSLRKAPRDLPREARRKLFDAKIEPLRSELARLLLERTVEIPVLPDTVPKLSTLRKELNKKLDQFIEADSATAIKIKRELEKITLGTLAEVQQQATALADKLEENARLIGKKWLDEQLAAARPVTEELQRGLRTVRMLGKAPVTESLEMTRDALAYYFKQDTRVIALTASALKFRRKLEGEVAQQALQLRAQANALEDEIRTVVEGKLTEVLESFAGLTRMVGSEVFPNLRIGRVETPSWLKIQHGQDAQRLTAWAKVTVDADEAVLGKAPTLFTIGPARIVLGRPRLYGTSEVRLDENRRRRETTQASLRADWRVEIGGKMLFELGGAELRLDERGKLSFDFSPRNLRLSPELSMFSEIMKSLDQGLTDSGFSLAPRANGVRVAYDMLLPPLGAPAGGITNAALSTHVDLSYEKGKLSLGMGAWLSKPERPFAVSVAFLAGGGYAGFTLSTTGKRLVLDVEIAISAGAAAPIHTGFMKGSAGIMLSGGILFRGGKGQLGATMTLAIWGHFDFGIGSANVSATLRIVYDGKHLTGRGYVRVTFRLSRWLKISVGGNFDLPFVARGKSTAGHQKRFPSTSPAMHALGVATPMGAAGRADTYDAGAAAAAYLAAIEF